MYLVLQLDDESGYNNHVRLIFFNDT
jgi:hypothetical protein